MTIPKRTIFFVIVTIFFVLSTASVAQEPRIKLFRVFPRIKFSFSVVKKSDDKPKEPSKKAGEISLLPRKRLGQRCVEMIINGRKVRM